MSPFVSTFLGTFGMLVFSANALICLGFIIHAWARRDQLSFWAPPTYVAAIFMYYCVVGPWVILSTSGYVDRGYDLRPYLIEAWTGSLVALVSWVTGYSLFKVGRRRVTRVQKPYVMTNRGLRTISIVLLVVGASGFLLVTGQNIVRYINPYSWSQDAVATTTAGYTGAFANYFGLAVNFMIPGVALMTMLYMRRYTSLVALVAVICMCTIVFLTIGFRYRLVLLFASILFVVFITKRRRPNIFAVVIGVAIALVVMGEIGAMRRYGEGLDFSARGVVVDDSITSAFAEAGIFGTSGAVIAMVPAVRPFVGWEPLMQTLLMPIPSQIYTAKSSASYIHETLMVVYDTTAYQGAAYMSFAEAYLSFGWPGIVVSHCLLGWICRWIWHWYLSRQENPLALLVYGSVVPYLYVVFSRGYLPQVTALFGFTVLPTILIYRWSEVLARITGRRLGSAVGVVPPAYLQ